VESTPGELEPPLWIELRGPEGGVLAHRGLPADRLFTTEDEGNHFRNRQALYKVVSVSGNDVVVEVFPLYVPPALLALAPPTTSASNPSARRRAPLVVEIALPVVVRDSSVIWPIRRNLAINGTGALALLATVVLAGVGFRSYARGRRLELQLEVARDVQTELLPSGTDALEPLVVAAAYRPAEQVSGDFYDAFRIGDGRIALVLGDVSGKGVPAALVTGVMHGAIRSSGWSDSRSAHERESGRLNLLLCEKASEARYASMVWAYYDPLTRRLCYVNAGHYPPLLIRPRGHEPDIVRLDGGGGPVLGMLPAARYVQAGFAVSPGDVLVLYSDGLTEATNTAGEEYGETRLRAFLATTVDGNPQALRDAILASVSAFLETAPLRDDLTLVVAKFT
jgi:sigma-B regulation protein RsbU (phosphoserine phosphatase)